MHKKKFPRICTSMHSGGFELTKLTYTRLRDNLIRHRGDRHHGSGPVGSDRIRRVFKYHASGPVGVGSNQKGFRISWVGSCWVGFQKPGLLTGDPDPDPTRPDPTRPDPTRPDPTRPDQTRARSDPRTREKPFFQISVVTKIMLR